MDLINDISQTKWEMRKTAPNFNPRNTTSITVVKIFVFLDLNEKS